MSADGRKGTLSRVSFQAVIEEAPPTPPERLCGRRGGGVGGGGHLTECLQFA